MNEIEVAGQQQADDAVRYNDGHHADAGKRDQDDAGAHWCLDILPTAIDAAGLTAPDSEVLDGISLLPALKAGKDLQPDRAIFWAGSHYERDVTKESVGHDNPPPAWAIRRGDWKLIQILEQGKPRLFNIADDPSEANDVIAQQPEIASNLRKAWVEWFHIGGDPIAWNRKYYQQLKNVK